MLISDYDYPPSNDPTKDYKSEESYIIVSLYSQSSSELRPIRQNDDIENLDAVHLESDYDEPSIDYDN